MRNICPVTTLLSVIGVLWVYAAGPVWADGFMGTFQCPHAQILCLEKVGYNFRQCGTLTGMRGQAQEFPLCPARDHNACVPCWYPTVAETQDLCRVEYGPDCGAFTEKDANWKGEWSNVQWPDLTLLYSLFN